MTSLLTTMFCCILCYVLCTLLTLQPDDDTPPHTSRSTYYAVLQG